MPASGTSALILDERGEAAPARARRSRTSSRRPARARRARPPEVDGLVARSPAAAGTRRSRPRSAPSRTRARCRLPAGIVEDDEEVVAGPWRPGPQVSGTSRAAELVAPGLEALPGVDVVAVVVERRRRSDVDDRDACGARGCSAARRRRRPSGRRPGTRGPPRRRRAGGSSAVVARVTWCIRIGRRPGSAACSPLRSTGPWSSIALAVGVAQARAPGGCRRGDPRAARPRPRARSTRRRAARPAPPRSAARARCGRGPPRNSSSAWKPLPQPRRRTPPASSSSIAIPRFST